MKDEDLDRMEREAEEINQIDAVIELLEDKIVEMEVKLASEPNGK